MDIDIRPVPVDRLAQEPEPNIVARQTRLKELDEEFSKRVASLQKELEETLKLHQFIQAELVNAELAQKLARGDVVRVVCPACSGTGMKSAVVSGGQVRTGSAFENTGSTVKSPVIDERNRCNECKGQQWIIMTRFKG